MERQPREDEITRHHGSGERLLERPGFRRRDLVLNRYMKARRMFVLRSQQTVESLGQPFAQIEHGRADEAQASASPQIHHSVEARGYGRSFRFRRQSVAQFVFDAGRQRVKQRDVRLQKVAFRRKMHGSQLVGARLQRLGQFGGHYQRSGAAEPGQSSSPRARRMANQLRTFSLCSASVVPNTWPPLPFATMYSAFVGAGSSTAAIDSRPGLVIGPLGSPLIV